jgi:hypothetical protein
MMRYENSDTAVAPLGEICGNCAWDFYKAYAAPVSNIRDRAKVTGIPSTLTKDIGTCLTVRKNDNRTVFQAMAHTQLTSISS